MQVDFHEMRSGLKRMDTDPPMDLKKEDFNREIIHRGLALSNAQLDLQCFKTFVSVQLKEVRSVCLSRLMILRAQHSRTAAGRGRRCLVPRDGCLVTCLLRFPTAGQRQYTWYSFAK